MCDRAVRGRWRVEEIVGDELVQQVRAGGEELADSATQRRQYAELKHHPRSRLEGRSYERMRSGKMTARGRVRVRFRR